MPTKTEKLTQTVEAPGATITYDVRRNETSRALPLVMVGSPMGAEGFTTLASLFTDRTVITYDPRGVERSLVDDQSAYVDPDVHAEDIRRVIAASSEGPVDLFASSGGAVNALALVAHYPDLVRTLVAHEPPLTTVLPDRHLANMLIRSIGDTYQRGGWGAGMAHFTAVISHQGEFTEEFVGQPAPDPESFGMPSEDDGSRTDPMLSQNLITCTHYQPDFAALKAASTRIVVAVGVESGEEMAARGARGVAARLGEEVEEFPSHHGGFLGGEYGWSGDPDAFAGRLREVLET